MVLTSPTADPALRSAIRTPHAHSVQVVLRQSPAGQRRFPLVHHHACLPRCGPAAPPSSSGTRGYPASPSPDCSTRTAAAGSGSRAPVVAQGHDVVDLKPEMVRLVEAAPGAHAPLHRVQRHSHRFRTFSRRLPSPRRRAGRFSYDLNRLQILLQQRHVHRPGRAHGTDSGRD